MCPARGGSRVCRETHGSFHRGEIFTQSAGGGGGAEARPARYIPLRTKNRTASSSRLVLTTYLLSMFRCPCLPGFPCDHLICLITVLTYLLCSADVSVPRLAGFPLIT